MSVQEAIVMKLRRANEAEIELAQLAQQKSENNEIKQFAQTLIQDHQACNEKLHQLDKSASASQERTPGAGRTNTGINPAQPRGQENASTGSDRTSGQGMAQGGGRVPQMLVQIAEEACQNSLQMTKDMLSQYDGQDFQMAFLGQQCVAHTMMLAELKAIESNGPEELKSLVQEAHGKVEQHLEKAKELAKKLEDDRNKNS
jgi:predicted outer membrane protein